VHLQPDGLPDFGFVDILDIGHPFVDEYFAQNSSTGSFFLHAKHLAIGSLQQIFHGGARVVVVFFTLTLANWQ